MQERKILISNLFPQLTSFTNLYSIVNRILNFTSRLHFSTLRPLSRFPTSTSSKLARFVPRNKKFYIGLIVVLVLFLLARSISSPSNSSGKIQVSPASETQSINKEFSFPLTNSEGEEISKIKFNLQDAELRDQIIVKGQRATAVEGRTFLILNLKITNDYDKSLEIDTRDYIRLSINGNEEEWIAPDIHNDPVEVQAQATKYTRVGFPINVSDESLKIRVGEIDGKKDTLDLSF